jgi:hypothetical protein
LAYYFKSAYFEIRKTYGLRCTVILAHCFVRGALICTHALKKFVLELHGGLGLCKSP